MDKNFDNSTRFAACLLVCSIIGVVVYGVVFKPTIPKLVPIAKQLIPAVREHIDTASEPSEMTGPWYMLSNYNKCNLAQHPESPAYLVEFDKAEGLIDNVHIVEQVGGRSVVVKVGEPSGNGMESQYTFIRGKTRCEGYAKTQLNKLDDLR